MPKKNTDHSIIATDEKSSSFGLIAQIYHSGLSTIMRNDCACRIVAKIAHADAVSILMYDGSRDRLINNGTYINADRLEYRPLSRDKQLPEDTLTRERHVLKYITVYDFLLDRFHDLGIPEHISDEKLISLINDFKSPDFKHFNYKFLNEDLPEAEFTTDFIRTCIENSIRLATSRKAKNGYHTLDKTLFYSRYKKVFKEEEQYPIGPNVPNPSGRLYYRTIAEGDLKIGTYDASRPFLHLEDLMSVGDDGLPKAFNNFLINICRYSLIRGNSDARFAYHYTGIPIWSGKRCIGVIRILINDGNEPLQHDDIAGRGSRVRHATEMLGYFLDQSYAEQYVDDISHDWSEVEFPDSEVEARASATGRPISTMSGNRHNRYCSKLRRAMNSYGCILRLSNFKGATPKVVGKSIEPPEFTEFVDYVAEHDSLIVDGYFNKNLARYFPSTNQTEEEPTMKDDFRLVGIAVELDYDIPAKHKSTYYYCSKRKRNGRMQDSEYVRETTDTYIFKGGIAPDISDYFHLVVLVALKHFSVKGGDDSTTPVVLKHVLMMDIPALDVDGLITFQNTVNRPFNLMDVRFAYGEMKRFGLEKSKSNKLRDKTFGDSAGYFVHVVSKAVMINLAQIKQLQTQLIESDTVEVENTLTEIYTISSWIDETIENLKRLATLNQSGSDLNKYQLIPWNLNKEIATLCGSLSAVGAMCKSTKVHFHNDVPLALQETNLNSSAVLLCIFNIVENALKYSFNRKNKRKIPDFTSEVAVLRGDVQVSLGVEDGQYVLNVVNWGCSIPDRKDDINSADNAANRNHFLGRNAVDLDFHNGQMRLWEVSSGIGLQTLTKFSSLLGGSWSYEHVAEEFRTTFTLKISFT